MPFQQAANHYRSMRPTCLKSWRNDWNLVIASMSKIQSISCQEFDSKSWFCLDFFDIECSPCPSQAMVVIPSKTFGDRFSKSRWTFDIAKMGWWTRGCWNGHSLKAVRTKSSMKTTGFLDLERIQLDTWLSWRTPVESPGQSYDF